MLFLLYGWENTYGEVFEEYFAEHPIHTLITGKAKLTDITAVETEIFTFPLDRIILINDYREQNIVKNLVIPIRMCIWAYKYNFHITVLNIYHDTKNDKLSDHSNALIQEFNTQILNLHFYRPISQHHNTWFTDFINSKQANDGQQYFSVVPEMMPIALDMILNGATGDFLMVNKDTLSEVEIMNNYKNIVDEDYNFSINYVNEEENVFNERLLNLYPDKVINVETALIKFLNKI